MKYRQDLQIALRSRYARLVQTGFRPYDHEVRIVRDWIAAQPALRSIVEAATAAAPEPGVDEWLAICEAEQGLVWPGGEQGRAALVWGLMCRIADAELSSRQVAWQISHETNLDNATRELTQAVFQHLFDFLGEWLGTDSEMLHLLERYKRQVEWFDRDALYATYQDNTAVGEAGYDRHLRQFLFSQGVDYPFTQSRGPSGATDVLAALDGDDPLVCEVKLYDGKDKGKRAVASGLNQAVQYAQDYGKTVAYLVVANLSGRDLQFPTDGEPKVWPPRLELAGVTVHLVAVRALPTATASKVGKAAPIVFRREDLTDQD